MMKMIGRKMVCNRKGLLFFIPLVIYNSSTK
jgi:hypothetical protein